MEDPGNRDPAACGAIQLERDNFLPAPSVSSIRDKRNEYSAVVAATGLDIRVVSHMV